MKQRFFVQFSCKNNGVAGKFAAKYSLLSKSDWPILTGSHQNKSKTCQKDVTNLVWWPRFDAFDCKCGCVKDRCFTIKCQCLRVRFQCTDLCSCNDAEDDGSSSIDNDDDDDESSGVASVDDDSDDDEADKDE